MATPDRSIASEPVKVHGRCHCGDIAYEATVDGSRVTVCHCTDCQMLTGTAFRTTVPTLGDTFVMRSGRPVEYVKTAESGTKRVHGFCGRCGTPVYSKAIDSSGPRGLRVGCLDERALLTPSKQQWCRSALPWASDLHDVPRVERG
jgi:hypothetical protein